jgi:hypothetical protein
MTGFQSDQQPKLFYPSINLEQRIPDQHVLRRIRSQVDLDFIYDEVRDRYGIKGNVFVPPPVIPRMMLLLVLYNVRSERELMNTRRDQNIAGAFSESEIFKQSVCGQFFNGVPERFDGFRQGGKFRRMGKG